MLRRVAFLLGLTLVGCAPASRRAGTPGAVDPVPRIHYRISLDSALKTLSARVCAEGFRTEWLEPPTPEAVRRLQHAELVTKSGTLALQHDSERIRVPAQPVRTCVAYTVDLAENSDELHVLRAGGDVLASPDVWLWDLSPRPEAASVTAEFALPKGVNAAFPWHRLARGSGAPSATPDATLFRVPSTAFIWKTAGAFGRFEFDEIEVNGGTLEVAFLDGFATKKDVVLGAVTRAARATAQFYGQFPVSRALAVVAPRQNRKRSFGMAVRGGGIMTVLLYPAHISQTELDRDWTAVHELLHLGVPRMPVEDAWFFEGIATYYTEVVRARVGMQTEQEAFQELVSGFERGRRAGTGRTLQKESADMHETRAYHRVYWVGAALALIADVEVRQKGKDTLETALQSFARCCAATEDDWSAERAIAFCDSVLGADVLTRVTARYRDSNEFPDVGSLLERLGVKRDGTGQITLSDTAELSALRRSIVRASSPPVRQ